MKEKTGMNILVTGGLGFIGSNFILKVLKDHEDFSIINVDAEFFGSNHKNLIELKNAPNYEYVKCNITNRRQMEDLISRSDVVVNFAAESFVDRSIANADPFLVSNIRGAFTLLDITKKQKKRFVHISTDEVFGSIENDSAVETSKFNPSSPYAATKAAAELLINSYITTYDCDCVITRCTNNYGPRQFPEKLIPKLIYNIIYENNKINYVHTLNGSGLATPRVLAALLETHQTKDGSISIPSSLQPYTGLAEIK